MLTTAAFAADMPIAPPPAYAPVVEDFGGWYLRGDIGFSNQRIKNIHYYRHDSLLSLNQTSGFDTAGIFDVGVGYQFNNWFRADIIGQYRGSAKFHGLDVFTFSNAGVPTAGVDTYDGRKSEWVVLANAYVDLGTWWCVTPFIGAGIGMSRNTISDFVDTNTMAPSVAYAPSASKWDFAWALHAGAAYKVSPNFTVELAYSYLNLGDGVTGPLTTFDGFTVNQPVTFRNITSHDLKLGVRWNLNSPPAYAPPPLISKG